MRLLFRDKPIGEITNLQGDQPWWVGDFVPNSEASDFAEFFSWMVDEERNTLEGEPRFDVAWWTDENWFVEGNDGSHGIYVPAIYEDGEIYIRYRT